MRDEEAYMTGGSNVRKGNFRPRILRVDKENTNVLVEISLRKYEVAISYMV